MAINPSHEDWLGREEIIMIRGGNKEVKAINNYLQVGTSAVRFGEAADVVAIKNYIEELISDAKELYSSSTRRVEELHGAMEKGGLIINIRIHRAYDVYISIFKNGVQIC